MYSTELYFLPNRAIRGKARKVRRKMRPCVFPLYNGGDLWYDVFCILM